MIFNRMILLNNGKLLFNENMNENLITFNNKIDQKNWKNNVQFIDFDKRDTICILYKSTNIYYFDLKQKMLMYIDESYEAKIMNQNSNSLEQNI
jgi:ABC-type multidrug transport system ATPase subunit